jgi:hypothetical protein
MIMIMNANALIKNLDKFFLPLGFQRRGAIWNRGGKSVVDVVDVQTSKAGGTITINAGVLDPEVYATLWNKKVEEFVDQPTCTVCVRIGELIDGRDIWWELNDIAATSDVEEKIKVHVLPFLERMQTREAMERWLTNSAAMRKRLPIAIIKLAIPRKLLGDTAGACTLLLDLREKATGAGRIKIDEVAERLGCN